MLKGLIDPAKEVEKLNKKKAALQGTVDKLKKAMEVQDYESKVRIRSHRVSHNRSPQSPRIFFKTRFLSIKMNIINILSFQVPEDIRNANKEKLATSSLEIERLCSAVKTLATIST